MLRSLRVRCGFTLIELLVVIAIISVLVALIFPTVSSALARGRAASSLSNLRQWGLAIHMSLADRDDQLLPFDGPDNVSQAMTNRLWWANMLPPYVGQKPYLDINVESMGTKVPVPPEKSIFIDSYAKKPANAPYQSGPFKFFFCYVMNSKLNQSLPSGSRVWIGSIPRPSQTAVMVEMRTVPEELPPGDPHRGATLNRAKADWQRFAARHRNGGHIAMADGSARHFENKYVTTPVGGNYNKDDLIWNPLGVAN